MVFSSPVFLFLFLPTVLALYPMVPPSGWNALLLVASLVFYGYGEPRGIFIMLGSIVVNFAFGLWLDRAAERGRARLALTLAVIANLSILVAVKYTNFVIDNLNFLLPSLGVAPLVLLPIRLPIGISFFTFHALSYIIDVYRRVVRAERRPVNMALYIALFPQLVAGPIIRYHDIAAQIAHRTVTREGFTSGVRRFIIGLGKKVLIADTVAGPADAIFRLPHETLTPGLAWLGVVCYTLQIYFDFSGYSDMAIGLGRMFGFHFLENFNFPYAARSMTDFWRRWHISLSRWFRDYLYIPLGGNRRRPGRVYFNLVTVFFLVGLWHGASWSFVVWGLFHGASLVAERLGLGRAIESAWAPVRHGYVMLVVMVGWVFFRAPTLPGARAFLAAMAGAGPHATVDRPVTQYLDGQIALALVVGAIGSAPVVPLLAGWRDRLTSPPARTIVTGAAVAGLAVVFLASAVMLLAADTESPFIYFRF